MKIRIPANQISAIIAVLQTAREYNIKNNVTNTVILDSKQNHFEKYIETKKGKK